VVAAFTWSDAADLALAFFLVVVGLGLAWALLALSGALVRLSALIRGAQDELLPVINKVGGSVDRVNAQLDKLDQATGSAVDAVDAIDQAVRTVSFGVRRPIETLAGFSSGFSHGFATLRTRRNWKAAVASAKEASARRRADLADELRRTPV
jgi:tetrahydromethanopterin S-methyltransferase subunit B